MVTFLLVVLALVAGGWFGYTVRDWLIETEAARLVNERAAAQLRLQQLSHAAMLDLLTEARRSLDRRE